MITTLGDRILMLNIISIGSKLSDDGHHEHHVFLGAVMLIALGLTILLLFSKFSDHGHHAPPFSLRVAHSAPRDQVSNGHHRVKSSTL